jgi:hypothetical protein
MKLVKLSAFVALAATTVAEPAFAVSCYELWYERNAIFDENGYCFETELGQQTFDNSDCWTSSPRLSQSEQQRVNRIRRQERAMGCKVNQ